MVASVENVSCFKPEEARERVLFPGLGVSMDILGNVVEEAGLGQEMGERIVPVFLFSVP